MCVLDPSALAAFALTALARTPEAHIDDLYKFLLQATRGGEHAAPDATRARAWLAREWDALPTVAPRADAPVIEPLRPDHALVRLHLHPARARGLTQAAVLDAFLASARAVPTDAPSFIDAWTSAGERLHTHPQGHLTQAAWGEFDAAMRPARYPAVHHSRPYAQAHAPAYRVMRGVEADALLRSAR